MPEFFAIGPRNGYASYSVTEECGRIEDSRIIPPHRVVVKRVEEYFGNPPRKKAGKKGNIHISASSYFVDPKAKELLNSAARGVTHCVPVEIVGRHEMFSQLWVLNFVDCLDRKATLAGPPGNFYKGKIGVIKKAAFDLGRWDGSHLFVVPEDPRESLNKSTDHAAAR